KVTQEITTACTPGASCAYCVSRYAQYAHHIPRRPEADVPPAHGADPAPDRGRGLAAGPGDPVDPGAGRGDEGQRDHGEASLSRARARGRARHSPGPRHVRREQSRARPGPAPARARRAPRSGGRDRPRARDKDAGPRGPAARDRGTTGRDGEMSDALIELEGVRKSYRFFTLRDVDLTLDAGQVMGLVGPNGAGKSTTIRIAMGLTAHERGSVRLLGRPMPEDQAAAKRDVAFVSDDVGLYSYATVGWHMRWVASIFPSWDARYAGALTKRFNLHEEQRVKGLSRGERVKLLLLLALARRPRLLVLDEPTAGLDPVARHEVLAELMSVIEDERRGILFSSHNTQDVEQISDCITFIDRGAIVESSDKETFLDRWRRLHLVAPACADLPALPGVIDLARTGQLAVATVNRYTPEIAAAYERAGAKVCDVQRMTLEEIFVANVMASRKERGE